jgi:thioredoxin 1
MESKKRSFSDILTEDNLVLIDFFAEWCGPCKMMAPILTQVKATQGEKFTVLKVDVDKNPKAAAHFQVQGVPTLVLYKQGNAVWRQSGVISANQLNQIIQSHA